MKLCTMCGETKTDSEFHRDKSRLDGLSSACKDCRNKRRKDSEALRKGNEKRCTRCRQYKPLDAFAIDNSKADGHRSTCKACINTGLTLARLKAGGKTLGFLPPKPKAMRRCRVCGKPVNSYQAEDLCCNCEDEEIKKAPTNVFALWMEAK